MRSKDFNRREKMILSNIKAGPVTLVIILLSLVCFLSLFFLAQVSQSSTKSYEIADLEKKVKELKEQNKVLELKAAELRSFENIKNEAEKLNMVSADKIVYIKQSGRSVAVANK
jgi:cell division protein FtsL